MNVQKQFLAAVALRRPYAFSDTGLVPGADGSVTLSAEDMKVLSRNVVMGLGVAVVVGGVIGYAIKRAK